MSCICQKMSGFVSLSKVGLDPLPKKNDVFLSLATAELLFPMNTLGHIQGPLNGGYSIS